MASAKRDSKTVTKMVEVTEEVPGDIVLTLSHREASLIRALLSTNPRFYKDATEEARDVLSALRSVGVDYVNSDFYGRSDGTIVTSTHYLD